MWLSRELPNGRTLTVYPLTFGRGRLQLGRGYDVWDEW
jgi:hypothetical protein